METEREKQISKIKLKQAVEKVNDALVDSHVTREEALKTLMIMTLNMFFNESSSQEECKSIKDNYVRILEESFIKMVDHATKG